MTFDDFHNRLRILSSIDRHELAELDAEIWTAAEYLKFRNNPWSYFIAADDEVAVMIWSVVTKRAGKPQRDGVTPEFLDASARAATACKFARCKNCDLPAGPDGKTLTDWCGSGEIFEDRICPDCGSVLSRS